jgi:predicted O-linked N-acetylglucosamine transferase (SPINDLY family)
VLDPGLAAAHNLLGVVLAARGQPAEAQEHLHRAARLAPGDAQPQHNLALLLHGQRRYPEALARFEEALRLRPDFPEAHLHRAHALARLGRLDEALDGARRALGLRPDFAEAHVALGDLRAQQGHLDESRACFEGALRLWPDDPAAYGCLLNALNLDPQLDQAALLGEHRRWAERHGRVERLGPDPDHDYAPDRPLRVGYLSADFLGHVLARFVEPLLAHHDPVRVEVFCYADVPSPDAITARLRTLARHWQPVCGLTDAEVAGLVRRDRVDVLVDLAGHTGLRLGVFARQPAPLQVTYLGYPNTTGLDAMHYRLTDAVADPEGEPVGHTETLMRLPGGFCCYAPPPDAPPVGPLPAAAAGYVTFGSTHKLAKLNDAVLDLWCQALRAAPEARLLVFRDALTGSARASLQERLGRRGVPAERLVLRHAVEQGQPLLAVYGDIDVLLDAFPWGGHATACEALWMGVPVLTPRGDRHAGRMVASVLAMLGLQELIADGPDDFVARAARLAGDRDRLRELRAGLRGRMKASSLCDGPAFTRHLEDAYREMWRRTCATP